MKTPTIVRPNGPPPTDSDPSGKKRKLIPFLLRPTALNSLARQVAYKSLVGLSKEARKTAILDAIAPKPAKQDIAQVRAELAETASPQPALNEKKQLDAGPNKVFDKPLSIRTWSTFPIRNAS